METSLRTEFEVCLRLEQGHFGGGFVDIVVSEIQAKGIEDELSKVIAVEEGLRFFFAPVFEKLVWIEACRVLSLSLLGYPWHVVD